MAIPPVCGALTRHCRHGRRLPSPFTASLPGTCARTKPTRLASVVGGCSPVSPPEVVSQKLESNTKHQNRIVSIVRAGVAGVSDRLDNVNARRLHSATLVSGPRAASPRSAARGSIKPADASRRGGYVPFEEIAALAPRVQTAGRPFRSGRSAPSRCEKQQLSLSVAEAACAAPSRLGGRGRPVDRDPICVLRSRRWRVPRRHQARPRRFRLLYQRTVAMLPVVLLPACLPAALSWRGASESKPFFSCRCSTS